MSSYNDGFSKKGLEIMHELDELIQLVDKQISYRIEWLNDVWSRSKGIMTGTNKKLWHFVDYLIFKMHMSFKYFFVIRSVKEKEEKKYDEYIMEYKIPSKDPIPHSKNLKNTSHFDEMTFKI